MRRTHTQLQSSKESTTGQEREGGLRTAVKDRHRLITAERDGETSESEQR